MIKRANRSPNIGFYHLLYKQRHYNKPDRYSPGTRSYKYYIKYPDSPSIELRRYNPEDHKKIYYKF